MGTYNPYFENNVETMRCPICGDERPLDWFGRRVLHIKIRNATTHTLVHEIRYRKFKACWKCREFHKELRYEIDPYTLVPQQYRNPKYTISAQVDKGACDDE